MMQTYKLALLTVVLLGCAVSLLPADDWPMLGRDGTRNAVSPEKNPPTFWQIEGVPTKFENLRPIEWETESKNVKWTAQLGARTFSTPVVSDGLVWIGTTHRGSDPGRPGLLKCFRESDGELLYEYESPVHESGDRYTGASWQGISGSPLVEGDRLWFISLRAEIVCLDISLLKSGEGEPSVVWKCDMRDQWGVYPYACIMGPGFTGTVAVHQNLLYTITGHGGRDRENPPRTLEAPSLVCLDKYTGELIWQDSSPGENILDAQWGTPLIAEIDGRVQVIVPQGDGWIRSFDALSGTPIWWFDINAKESVWEYGGTGTRNYFMGSPVFYEGRVFIASGQTPEHGEGPGRLVCIEPTMSGDISSELAVDADGNPLPHRRIQAVNPAQGEQALPNPNSGLVWEYTKFDRDGDGEYNFQEKFHRSHSNVVIKDGLLIATDLSGLLLCADARTGKVHWTNDRMTAIWGTPLIADDKIYVMGQDGEVAIFNLSADPAVAMQTRKDGKVQPISLVEMGIHTYSSPVFANGVLYIATRNRLFAISDQQPVPVQDEPAPGGHWPQWRGPNRDNVSTETGLLQQWPEGGPPLLWRVDGLPQGIASVSIADGQISTIGRVDDREYITTLDEKTGKHLWTAYLGRTIQQSPLMQWLTQRTPTVAGQHLYAASSLGDIVCLQTDDGREVWRKSYEDDLQGHRGRWGYADRPLVDGDKLIVMPGGETGSVTALNRWTGEVLWKCGVAEETYSPYGVGVIAEIHGVRQFVAALSGCLVGIAVEDGRLLWRHEGIGSPTSHNILTPLVRNHHAVFPIGFRGQQLLSVEIDSQDDGYAAQDVYAVPAWLDPFEDNTCVVDEHLYIFGTVTSCHCWRTGEVAWQTRMARHKTTGTYAGGRAYLRDAAGTVKLLEISPAGWVEHGKFVLPEAQCASGATLPVIAGGRLYLRDDSRLFCYDVRDDAMERPPTTATTIQLPAPGADAQQPPGRPRVGINRAPDAVFVPTPDDVVVSMLQLAGVEKTDVVYDLGSGDGRIVIAAAETYEAQAVGVEIDPELVQLSRQQVTENQLEDFVTIRHEDLFQTDFSEADVVAVFLFPQLLDRLMPQFEKLKPGTRIVSHQFEIPGVQPDQTIRIRSNSDGELHRILLWTTPLKTVQPPE